MTRPIRVTKPRGRDWAPRQVSRGRGEVGRRGGSPGHPHPLPLASPAHGLSVVAAPTFWLDRREVIHEGGLRPSERRDSGGARLWRPGRWKFENALNAALRPPSGGDGFYGGWGPLSVSIPDAVYMEDRCGEFRRRSRPGSPCSGGLPGRGGGGIAIFISLILLPKKRTQSKSRQNLPSFRVIMV